MKIDLMTTPMAGASPLFTEFQGHVRKTFEAEGFILSDEEPRNDGAEQAPLRKLRKLT
jgi:hypothetical protein